MAKLMKGCECLHGTCTSDDTCTCAAGWITNSTTGNLCDTCSPGFFQTKSGDCLGKYNRNETRWCADGLVCPLGCSSCTLQDGTESIAACTACTSPLVLSSADSPRCISPQICQAGQYWDTSSSSCSRYVSLVYSNTEADRIAARQHVIPAQAPHPRNVYPALLLE